MVLHPCKYDVSPSLINSKLQTFLLTNVSFMLLVGTEKSRKEMSQTSKILVGYRGRSSRFCKCERQRERVFIMEPRSGFFGASNRMLGWWEGSKGLRGKGRERMGDYRPTELAMVQPHVYITPFLHGQKLSPLNCSLLN